MRATLQPLQRVIRQYTPPKRQPRIKGLSPEFWHLLSSLRIRIIGQPTVVADEKTRSDNNAMPKAAFYAVRIGKVPGIYNTWNEAEVNVKGFKDAKHKKFPTLAAAQQYMRGDSSPYASKGSSTAAAAALADPRTARESSPPLIHDPSALPPHLQELANKGFNFSAAQRLLAYTDGSGLSNGKKGARAGLGVYWGSQGEAYEKNLSERVPGLPQTNNRGELLSVIRAVEDCPYPELPLEIRTDSQYTISCMTTYLPRWIKNGFITSSGKGKSKASSQQADEETTGGQGIKNVDLVKHLLVLLRRRQPKASVRFKYVKAHVGHTGNEAADKLAKRGAIMPELPDRDDWLDPDEPDEDYISLTEPAEPIVIDVEMDADCLLTVDEMRALEGNFELQE